MSAAPNAAVTFPEPGKRRGRVVGPRLRRLLYLVFALVALIGANSIYLASVTVLEWFTESTYQDYFYQYMFLLHLVLGLLLITPFVVFGILHMLAARGRRNRRAVRIGYALFVVACLLLLSGLLLTRVAGVFDLKQPLARSVVYWLHVICPLAAIWLYWLHRLAGPRIKWRLGMTYAAAVATVVVIMVFAQSQDPRQWGQKGSAEGLQYFHPSPARTRSGKFIPARALMNDQYCLKCHKDVHDGWKDSVHRWASFNNDAYLAAIRETREVSMRRDGNVKAARWCAGCHDPAPFFSGAFDRPDYDDVNDATAHAGITCTACHAITNINSHRGNGDYTIEEPMHYPFAYSENSFLQWVNETMLKAKPSFHKKTFLKDFHTTAEFCSVCHKVSLPKELTKYKDFLRGQNHYDNYLLSGVSGHGARSFYYPRKAEVNCNGCHMPLRESQDFGAKLFAGATKPSVHDHLFLGANTAIAWLRDRPEVILAHQEFLKDCVRVDIFGVKEGGGIDGRLHAPLRPATPTLKPGGEYLLETVVRTLRLGHLFTQGTADSNEVWLEATVTSGDRVIGRSGAIDERQEVDPWSHFINVFMLDRNGNRIARRNAQDIFVPLYNHQIPPGAGQAVHYHLKLPTDLTAPVRVELKLNYRKFDKQYADFMASSRLPQDPLLRGQTKATFVNELPVTVLASDAVVFAVEGVDEPANNPERDVEDWERWNDYGIGLLLKGKAELRQATHAFARVEELKQYHGPLNLARVLFREGRLDEAVDAIARASEFRDPAPPPWTIAWLSGRINRQQGYLSQAEKNFRSVLEEHTPEMIERKFDFSLDYEVINELGGTLFDLANQQIGAERQEMRSAYLTQAIEQFQRTLAIDPENVTAHYNLQLLYGQLGEQEKSAHHRELHARYKPDDNSRDRAVALARERYPAANHAAEALVIYSLNRGDQSPNEDSTGNTTQRRDGDKDDE